jgi:carbamoylphosphate synthase small subunit
MPPESARNAALRLKLDDGTQVQGCGFGALKPARGEVVFNTAMAL